MEIRENKIKIVCQGRKQDRDQKTRIFKIIKIKLITRTCGLAAGHDQMGLSVSVTTCCETPTQTHEHFLQDHPYLGTQIIEIWPAKATYEGKM